MNTRLPSIQNFVVKEPVSAVRWTAGLICVVMYVLQRGWPIFLWQGATPLIVDEFVDRTCKNNSLNCVSFYNTQIICKCCRGPHNAVSRAAGSRHSYHSTSKYSSICVSYTRLSVLTCFSRNFNAVFCYVTHEIELVGKHQGIDHWMVTLEFCINSIRRLLLNYRNWKLCCMSDTTDGDLIRPWQRILI